MATTLEGATKRFIGSSNDERPQLDPRDAGSTFFETDTGNIHRWDGRDWTLPTGEDLQLLTLQELLLETKATRTGIEVLLLHYLEQNNDLRNEVVVAEQ